MLLWLRWRLGERKPHLVKRLLKWLPQAYLSRWGDETGEMEAKKKLNLQLNFLQHMHENRWRPFRAPPLVTLMENQSSVWNLRTSRLQKNVQRFVIKLKIHKEVGKYWGVDVFLCCFCLNIKNKQSNDSKYRLILRRWPRVRVSHFNVHFNKKETNGIVLEPCVFNEARTLFCTC